MSKIIWKTAATTGPVLQGVLQSLTDSGWAIHEIFEHGVAPQNLGKVVGAGQTVIAAMFTVIAFKFTEVNGESKTPVDPPHGN